jgi:predicted DNA-binding transcriptional regulator AlpA
VGTVDSDSTRAAVAKKYGVVEQNNIAHGSKSDIHTRARRWSTCNMPNTQTTNHDKPRGRAAKLERAEQQIAGFDKLANARLVPVEVVAGLMGVHVATVWGHVKAGHLPQPVRIGRTTRWQVGALRAVLAGGK